MPLPLFWVLAAAGAGAFLLSRKNIGSETPPNQQTPGDDGGENGASPGDAETESETAEGGEVNRTAYYDEFVTSYAQSPFHNLIASSESRYGIPQNMLARLLWQESKFDPAAVGDNGQAVGIAQFHTDAASDMGISAEDRINPDIQIPAAARYLKAMYNGAGNDWFSALVAYNWGIGQVQKFGADAAPPNTLAYAESILADSEAA